MSTLQAPIEHTLHAHSRAITDINFAVFNPDMLATCAVDAFVHCWDLRTPSRPVISFSDWFAGATQVKWNRQDPHIIASSHDKYLRIWDERKGALPLKTIEAHETKIYGIDWNRTKASKIVTCSLDRTIKIWDYEVSEEEPERVIHTRFPVWRARHTPFGYGILAMPQRGNNDLHLYDYREDHAVFKDGTTEIRPNYSFAGHREQAKEFLWRARGTMSDNTDNRDFQLVTWGADRDLMMHRMGQKQLQAAGYEKGMQLEELWALTRRGAPYKTFREKPVIPMGVSRDDDHQPPTADGSNLAQSGTSPGMNKAPIPVAGGWTDRGSMMTYSGMETRNAKHQTGNVITWMKGVRFGKRGPSEAERRKSRRMSAMPDLRALHMDGLPETLSDEIIHVGDRFTKVTFEEANVSSRHVQVSLNGPWAPNGKLAFLQLRLDFPQDYPEAAPPHFQLEHTSSLPEEKFAEIENGLRTIAMGYLVHRKGCLEAILSYLLGERNLQESTEWLTMGENQTESEEQADSSSDEEDALLGESGPAESQTLDMEGSMGSGILSANANVPLPRSCGAVWAPNGRLVCFFPPKEEQRSILRHAVLTNSSRSRGGREIFEGFGRLHSDSPDPRSKGRSAEEAEDSETDDSSSTSSSNSSSASSSTSGDNDMVETRFRPPAAWHGGSIRLQRLKATSTDGSLPTSNSYNRKPLFAKNKTLIAIHDVDSLIPSKRRLAEEYLLFGDGPTLCAHNAEIASKYGLLDLFDIWEFIKLILSNNVPLEILCAANGKESIPVLAQRAMVRIKRKDSGLDISFDQPDGILIPLEKALVKWGKHPFAGTWLISRLFEHFEKSADVQMLAMLACVFAQPTAETGMGDGQYKVMPVSMRLPAQSSDYLPTKEAARGFFEPTISVSGSPLQSKTPGTVFGSAGSSGFRDSDPVTPYSTRATPPMPLSRASTQLSNAMNSLSTSPEQHRVSIPSATNTFASSVWQRPFTLASSPPTRQRLSGDDLSTSNPSNTVTWTKGARAVYRSDSTIRNSFMNQGLTEEYDEGSTTEEDEPPGPPIPIKMSLKNQHLFDDEASANVPFLDIEQATKFSCYREVYAHILGAWGLKMQRSEMLKYNGIVSTPANKRADRDSQSTLTLGRFGTTHRVEDGLGPHIVRCCAKCQSTDINAIGGKLETKCSKCNTKSQILPCTVCLEPIVGLYKVCLGCGHAAHASCHQSLLESLPQHELKCEAGCGCVCEEHAVVRGDEIIAATVEASQNEFAVHEGPEDLQIQYNTIRERRRGSVEARRAARFDERASQEHNRRGFGQSGRRRSFVG